MDKFFEVLASLTPIVATLSALGLITKYLPLKVLGYVRNELIPYLNTLVAFFGAFGGTTAVAHASVFGDVGHFLSIPARLAASVFVTILSRQLFEGFLRPAVSALGWKNNEILAGTN